MTLEELKALKDTPKSEMRNVINGLDIDSLATNRQLRRDIKLIQDGGKFYPTEFGKIIKGLMFETAKARYMDDDGEPMLNNTIVEAVARRDAFGESIPEYVKRLPGWDAEME